MIVAETQARTWLQGFEFKKLFNGLGWDHFGNSLGVKVNGEALTLQPVAQKGGFAVFECPPLSSGVIPDAPQRRKIHGQVMKAHAEHLIVYVDRGKTKQVWQWVRHEPGKPVASREFVYTRGQSGEALMQRLRRLAFTLEDEERGVGISEATGRARAAFDVERVTRRFYDRFKTEHDTFLKFLKGIPDAKTAEWYASVMLNRLMFLYFIQSKGLLDEDREYLQNQLARSQGRGDDRYYRDFLCPLFFRGLARREDERTPAEKALLGKVPYLDGGLFQRHQIEELHGEKIHVADAAFESLFDFFDDYHWHLDDRPTRNGREINPDVLGYIFEKYINQKQMGAYYTKEDITEYISKNTVIPYLFDAAEHQCRVAFEGPQSVWRLLQEDPDRYIYDAVKKGTALPLPDDIAAGVADVTKRGGWNRPAPDEYALPTEIWREVVARRKRYAEVRGKVERGEVRSVNDLVTLNLDIRQFAQDVIQYSEGPDLLRAFWRAIAGHTPYQSNEKAVAGVTVLDPTCGSGAFLFAALSILEPLYEACLDRMEGFVEEADAAGTVGHGKYRDFRAVLQSVAEHPNRRYFVLKSIIVNNLYGVDIMDEAVEICKLRLFLKLVAQVEPQKSKPNYGVEPLPDIDFNIRAGNTLVGFATYDEVKRATTTAQGGQVKMLLGDDAAVVRRIEEKADEAARAAALFRRQQTQLGGRVTHEDKAALRQKLSDLEDELNRYLAREYGVDGQRQTEFARWHASHKPFHWFIEFYEIMKRGGFDVTIGNPPYVEYRRVRSEYEVKYYETEVCGNLYAYVLERCLRLSHHRTRFGMIIPLSSFATERMGVLAQLMFEASAGIWVSNFGVRPSKLFDGVNWRLSVVIASVSDAESPTAYVTKPIRWSSEERGVLLADLEFCGVTSLVNAPPLPKHSTGTARCIAHKVSSHQGSINLSRRPTDHFVHYQEATQYWIKAMDRLPYYEKNGAVSPPAHARFLYFSDASMAHTMCAIMNSSLFYLHFNMMSDCYHLSDTLVRAFPIPRSALSDPRLPVLAKRLMDDLEVRATTEQIRTSGGDTIRYALLTYTGSKPIIDEIDRVLAKHYGFTDEELDYIINYDIKYRMGRDGGEEEEGE